MLKDNEMYIVIWNENDVVRSGSRTAAKSKMERFVIIVNGLASGCCCNVNKCLMYDWESFNEWMSLRYKPKFSKYKEMYPYKS